jgi:hypothetical protein
MYIDLYISGVENPPRKTHTPPSKKKTTIPQVYFQVMLISKENWSFLPLRDMHHSVVM